MSDKQIAALTKASQKKKQEAFEKTTRAIANLIAQKQKITIRSVAREAGVSVSYIYKYPELAYKIQTLREQQKYSNEPVSINLEQRLQTLEEEKVELIQEIEQLKVNLETVKVGSNAKSLQAENLRLHRENIQLQRELEFTKQNLQEAREFILGYKTQTESSTKIIRQVIKKY
jgi:ACT domain-containing protein